MARLTDAQIRDADLNGKSYQLRDSALPGFFLQVNRASKSFKIQADLYTGERPRRRLVRTVRKTLGRVGEMTLDDARSQAMTLLADIKREIDPNAPSAHRARWPTDARLPPADQTIAAAKFITLDANLPTPVRTGDCPQGPRVRTH